MALHQNELYNLISLQGTRLQYFGKQMHKWSKLEFVFWWADLALASGVIVGKVYKYAEFMC